MPLAELHRRTPEGKYSSALGRGVAMQVDFGSKGYRAYDPFDGRGMWPVGQRCSKFSAFPEDKAGELPLGYRCMN